MGIWNTIKGLFGEGSDEAELKRRQALGAIVPGSYSRTPIYPESNLYSHYMHGYRLNEIVYSAISRVTTALTYSAIKEMDKNGMLVEDSRLEQLFASPNLNMSGHELLSVTVQHLALTGNAYWHKVRVGNQIKEIWPLRPDRMSIIPDNKTKVGAFLYEINGQKHVIPPQDIVHFKHIGPYDELYGDSPIRAALREVAADNEVTDMIKTFLQNCGVPEGYLYVDSDEHTISPEDMAAYSRKWKQLQGGNNRGKVAVLEGGLKFEKLSFDFNQLAVPELREIMARRILMAFNVPPALVGLNDPTYNNQAEARLSFYEDTIIPLQKMLEAKINSDRDFKSILGHLQFDNSDVPALVERRQAEREQDRLDVQAGIMRINEARAARNMEEIDEKELMQNGQQENQEKESAKEEEEGQEEQKNLGREVRDLQTNLEYAQEAVETKDAEIRLLKKVLGRVSVADQYLDRLDHWVRRELKKHRLQLTSLIDVETKALDFNEHANIQSKLAQLESIWEQSALEAAVPLLNELFHKAAITVAEEEGLRFDLNDEAVIQSVSGYTQKFAKSFAGTSGKRAASVIQAAFQHGWSKADLKKELKSIFEGEGGKARADTVARTETIRVVNESARNVYKQAGVTKIKWSALLDGCPYCKGLDGKTVGIDTPFVGEYDAYMPDGTNKPLSTQFGPIQAPPAHPRCRCVIVADTEDI